MAASPISRPPTIRSSTSPTGSTAPKAASSQNGAKVAFKGPNGGIDAKASEKRTFTSDLYYGAITAYDTVNNKVLGQGHHRYRDPLGRARHRGRGGVFTATQDGWVVANNDETLEELCIFNIGTPLNGAPVTYSLIGPKQFLAVQKLRGRHLHPIKYDNLLDSALSVRVRAELTSETVTQHVQNGP